MKNRVCIVLVRGKMNSCLVEFENGQQEVVSRRSVRRLTTPSTRPIKRAGGGGVISFLNVDISKNPNTKQA